MVAGEDLDWALHRVSASYRVNAYEEDSAEYHLVNAIYDEAKRERMGGQEFRERIAQLCRTQKFLTWVLADFFHVDTPRLYAHSWYVERVAENRGNAAAIAGYRVTGYDKPLFGWRHEVRNTLPEFVPAEPLRDAEEDLWRRANASARKAAAPPEELNLLKENLALRGQIKTLEELLADARRRITELERDLQEVDDVGSDDRGCGAHDGIEDAEGDATSYARAGGE